MDVPEDFGSSVGERKWGGGNQQERENILPGSHSSLEPGDY